MFTYYFAFSNLNFKKIEFWIYKVTNNCYFHPSRIANAVLHRKGREQILVGLTSKYSLQWWEHQWLANAAGGSEVHPDEYRSVFNNDRQSEIKGGVRFYLLQSSI